MPFSFALRLCVFIYKLCVRILPDYNKGASKNAQEERKTVKMPATFFHVKEIIYVRMRINPGHISH